MLDTTTVLTQVAAWLPAHSPEAAGLSTERLAALPWKDLGLDSLKLAELVLELEDTCACELPNEALGRVRTFGDLAAAIVRATAGPEESRHMSRVPLPEASPAVVDVVLRRIWVYLAQVHHIELPRQELAALLFTRPRLRGVGLMDVIYELESTFALMLPQTTTPGMTVMDLAVLVAQVLAWEALPHPEDIALPC